MSQRILTDITLTENAKQRIDELKQDNKNIFIRIMITEGGCAGKQYYILMDDYIGETDYVLQQESNNHILSSQRPTNKTTITEKTNSASNCTDTLQSYNQENIYIVIDENSLEFLHNSTIDFENKLEFSGFKIDNPNISATCNCGNSFTCSGECVIKKEDCKN